MNKFNKGDWVGFVNPLCALVGLPRRYLPSREGIVVGEEGDQVQVLYTGDNSPVWVDAASLERIEVEKPLCL